MFRKMKNIDSAFRTIRVFTILIVLVSSGLCCLSLYWSFRSISRQQQTVYVIGNGQAFLASSSSRKENLSAEARDHVQRFHELFFTLDPDEASIRENTTRALYLADQSAKKVYDNLRERDFYSQLVAANVNQSLKVDSIEVDLSEYPYRFRFHGTQLITRPTTQTTRNLFCQGMLREVSRSENNSHGLLIERWEILDNRDLRTRNRK
ncbi:conjugative transposon protein TraK [Sphingobacterium sp.]|uniref:conjugative transposon protein TraK n=1 Tax=Sphingobacterium sp. TaxID=341027 RepID=UPI0028ADFA08|nr:conjugative transposon protein TraK [Sphingobacterium sp.]